MGCDEVTTEGTKLSEIIDSYCLNQLIDEPTHILPNSLFCIDLIITDQLNLFVDFGVHPSLYPKSHHQIVSGTTNLSVPRLGDSTINQLLSITHEICIAFEHHHDIRAAFLDISKAFDKMWHDGLLLKLKSNEISGPLLNLLSEFLCERYQRAVLNGKSSDWRMFTAGIPEGSVLGPLLFLVYINDLADNSMLGVRLFADDTSLFHVATDADISADVLNHDLKASKTGYFNGK